MSYFLPPSMLTRPGANTVKHGAPGYAPNTPIPQSSFAGHPTDATSGGSQGYGSFIDPSWNQTVQDAISALPNVAAAKLALTNQGGQSYDALRQAIQNAIVSFGDGSSFRGLSMVDPRTGLKTNAIDPMTNGLANVNTGAEGHWGNSVVGQLKQAAESALHSQLQAIGGSGFQSEGGYGSAINQSNIGLGHDIYNAGQQLLGQLSGSINTNQTTQTGLYDNYMNALLKGTNTVDSAVASGHGGLYGLPQVPVNTVGGGAPQSPYGRQASPYPQTNPMTFKPAPPGAGAFPTRTGGTLPLPKLPAAPTFGGMGHQT